MKAIFYVLALLVIGAAAFFSFQNVGKFKEQQSIKTETIAKNDDLTKRKNKKQEELTAEIDKRNEANREREALKSSISSLVAASRALQRDIATLTQELEGQKAKFAELEKGREDLNKILKEQGVDRIEDVPVKIQELKAEQTAKEKTLAELKTNIETLEKHVATNSEEIGRLTAKDVERSQRIGRNAMQSVVTSVNEEWGFVVIGAGSNTGFTPQTKLLVRRDGRLIGEVKPSSIEPSQTIAEIDHDTLAPGARIQPGDLVILSNPASD
jgi:predicted RNase H-like nuclease (RuvC/YqgF family)